MRLLKFLKEEANDALIKSAMQIDTPDPTEEYSVNEIKEYVKLLTDAIKESQKYEDNEMYQSARKDFTSKLRKWIKLFEDRFKDEELPKEIKRAKDIIAGKAPKPVSAPVGLDTPMPIGTAIKAGILPGSEEETPK